MASLVNFTESQDSQPSDHGDPLVNLTGISLFRSSLQPLPKPHSNTDEVEHTRNYLESLALQNSNKLLEQAQKIVASGSDALPEIASDMISKNQTEALPGKGLERPREQRRELAHEQASFSLVPKTRKQTDTACLEMKFDPKEDKEIEKFFAAEDKIDNAQSEILLSKGVERRRERRREWRHKPVSFSLVPRKQRDIAARLEMKFDPEKYNEPEEYFAEIYKIENAHREIEKHTGVVLPDQFGPYIPIQTRRDRLGNLWRQSEIKFRPPTSVPETKIIGSSQEMPVLDGFSPSYASSQKEIIQSDNVLQGEDLAASAEDKTQNILDELLSHSGEKLDDIGFLQECLKIKSFNIEKLVLPDLQFALRNDMKSTGGNVLKRRSIYPDTQRLFKRMSSETPANHRQKCESSLHNAASPALSGSPLAPKSVLYRRSSHSSLSSDHFSFKHIDQALASNSPLIQEIVKQSEQVAIENGWDGVGRPADHSTPHERVVGDFTSTFNKVLNDDPAGVTVGASSNGCQVDLGDNNVVNDFDETLKDANSKMSDTDQNDRTKGCTEASKEVASTLPEFSLTEPNVEEVESAHFNSGVCNEQAFRHGISHNKLLDADQNDRMKGCTEANKEVASTLPEFSLTEPNVEVESAHFNSGVRNEQVRHGIPHNMLSDADQNDRKKGCTESNKEVASTLSELSLTEPNVEEVESAHFSVCNEQDEADVWIFDNHAMNCISGNLDSSEQISKNDAVAGQPTMAKSNNQEKTKGYAGERRKTKQNSRRQSLAAVGTSWKDGVRRSTRNRTRPLEYWRGERLLYGRVHSTLTTVIGVKYVNPSVEVKSYISDDYKDLLEQAALH